MFLSILSSLLGILAFASFNFSYIFGFIFLAPLFIFILREEKLWRLLCGVFLFKIIFSIAVFYFLFEPFGFIASIFIFLGFPAVIFLLKKAGVWINSRFGLDFHKAIVTLSSPFLWIFFENLQAKYSFVPVYFGNVGNIFGSSPFVGIAHIDGLNSLSFFAILINILIAIIAINLGLGVKIANKTKNLSAASIVAMIAIVFIAAGLGVSRNELRKNADYYNNQRHVLKVGLVSNNSEFDANFLIFKNNVFTDSEKKLADTMINEKLNLLRNDLINKKMDILILPEYMIDMEIRNDADEEALKKFNISDNGILIKAYRKLAKELNVSLAATIIAVRNNERYSSTLLFNKDGELVDVYDKSHLTFGSDYWPFGDWRPFYYSWAENIIYSLNVNPKPDYRDAIFNKIYSLSPGKRKLLKNGDLHFASLICVEIHYPDEVEDLKYSGAQFISNVSSNRWISKGLKNYLYMTDNLRKIEAVWLETPILINGRYDSAGIITPDGKMDAINFEAPGINYALFTGEIRY